MKRSDEDFVKAVQNFRTGKPNGEPLLAGGVTTDAEGRCKCCGHKPTDGSSLVVDCGENVCLTCAIT